MKTEAEINAEKHAKPRVDIVPPALLLAAGRALGYGAAKHGVPQGYDGFGTWRIPHTEQAEPLTHYACLMRHMLLWRAGEMVDPESKLSHLDHAAAQLSILLDILERPPAGRGADPGPDETPETRMAGIKKRAAELRDDPLGDMEFHAKLRKAVL